VRFFRGVVESSTSDAMGVREGKIGNTEGKRGNGMRERWFCRKERRKRVLMRFLGCVNGLRSACKGESVAMGLARGLRCVSRFPSKLACALLLLASSSLHL
jgi:hypothetical protein